MNRKDDAKLFYIMQDLFDNKPVNPETALYLDKIRNEIRTLTEIEIRSHQNNASVYSDIIGKWFMIYLLRNGRI